MSDLRISELPALGGPGLAEADLFPLTDLSAAQTKKITAKDLVQFGVKLIDPGSIPSDKFDLTLTPNSVGTLELQDGSVTAIKLADNSSGTVQDGLPAAGTRIGQLTVDRLTNKLYVWSGSEWLAVKGAGSINSLVGETNGLIFVTVSEVGDDTVISAEPAPTLAPRQFLAGPTTAAGNVTAREIVGLDLPVATSVERGAVIPSTGLTIDANGSLEIDNTVAPNNVRSLVTYDAKGLVQSGGPITGPDLPEATDNSPGVIIPGESLMVNNGVLDVNSSVTPGTYTKVTTNAYGVITAVGQLETGDLPPIDAGEISTGELNGALIADRSIEEIKLADYSTCYIQEGSPGSGSKLGQFWFTPSTNQLRVYARGSGPQDIWLSVGFGALQSQNLRWAGTIDADTSTIVSLTAIGVSEGLTAGGPIPAPTDPLSGVYFVTQVPGSNINEPNVSTDTFTEGDWLLCIDQAQGWTHIDAGAAGGGGGGGGAQYLDDLLDVEIGGNTVTVFGTPRIALEDGQLLAYNAINGMWVNADTIDGGTF